PIPFVPINACELFPDVIEDGGSHVRRQVRCRQHTVDGPYRESRCLVLGAEEHPRCATTEPEGRGLRIKTLKASRDQSLTQGVKFGCLTRLGGRARHLFFVVSRPVRDLLLLAKGLFVIAPALSFHSPVRWRCPPRDPPCRSWQHQTRGMEDGGWRQGHGHG